MSNVQGLKRRRIIIATELAGLTHGTTRASIELFESGVATTTRIVTVGPWANFAARHLASFDCGVALSFTSENRLFPLSPITASPSLTDGRGFFPASRAEFWEFAEHGEVLRECRAQIERAIDLGIRPTHISSLDAALVLRPEFFDVFTEVASEFGVALHPGQSTTITNAGYSPREIIAEENLIAADAAINFTDLNLNSTIEALMSFEKALESIATDTCELTIEAAIDSQETLDIFGAERAASQRISLEALTSNRARHLIDEYQIETISYQRLIEESSTEDL
jgi:predicted glycoside hydrolase/deacetylase ChbG (UPF0249 family)